MESLNGIAKAMDQLGESILKKEAEIQKLRAKIKVIEQYLETYEEYIKRGDE